MRAASLLRLPPTSRPPSRGASLGGSRPRRLAVSISAQASSASAMPAAEYKHPEIKRKILQVAALTDRGQRHNRLVSGAFEEERVRMEGLLDELTSKDHAVTKEALSGEWELVYSTCELFRSSPFFLAIEKAFGEQWKSDLFFKLHQLQVCSWGASTIGRISQRLDFEENEFVSEFDTTLFALTVIPIVGWFKLLPTFGGRVVTVAKGLEFDGERTLSMELDKTRVIDAPGVERIPLVNGLLMETWAPLNTVWKVLPWNWGGAPTCEVEVVYLDDDTRVMKDLYGQLFVYTRPME